MTEYAIPNYVTTIGKWTFSNIKSLTSVIIPNSVTIIEEDAFNYCSALISITIPDSVTSITSGAFRGCASLASFYGKYASDDNRCLIQDTELIAFAPVDLTSYTIPNNVTKIGCLAFNSCFNLTSITIPDSVIRIDSLAFEGCISLTSVTIPDSVTSIGNAAFTGCNGLTSVCCKPATPPTLGGTSVFADNATDRKIYVPAASVDAYKTAQRWSDYADFIVGYDF